MAELSFETLSFDKEKGRVKVSLLRQFYFYLDDKELEKIALFEIKENSIIFKDIPQEKAEKKFDLLLSKGMKELKNSLNDNPAVYVHQNSGIPLIGNVAFGLVYRDTSLIEVKPMTSCNLNCIYCSVGEGIRSNKMDFVVEKEYLLEEFRRLLKLIDGSAEAHIGIHGEPFLYTDILNLIKDLDRLKQVSVISIDTNGTLLNQKIIDELANCKKVRLNISLHTLNPKTARVLAGCPYNLEKIIEIIKYAKDKIKILMTPLIVPSYNDSEIEDLVRFAKENNLKIGLQNYLWYKTGRNPTKPWPWQKFYDLLKKLEEKYQIKLIVSPEDFDIRPAKKLEKPFVKDDVVLAEVVCPDRFKKSCLAAAKGRTISIPDCDLTAGKKVKVKITRDKHNIFVGKVV